MDDVDGAFETLRLRVEDGTISFYFNDELLCEGKINASTFSSVGFYAALPDTSLPFQADYIQIKGLK